MIQEDKDQFVDAEDEDVSDHALSDDNDNETDREDEIVGPYIHNEVESDGECGLFDPPLYKQRYHAVTDIINSVNAKRVIDMGCSEGQFLPVIKSMCPAVEEISGVDIDLDLLERVKYRLQPLTIEYLLKRDNPLTMNLFHGSIIEPDKKFSGIDFIACIEVIEHLVPDDLRHVPEAIFGVLKPKTVAITTPNSEFNVLFKDFSGMRHWDHKFEWTRQEFKDWCDEIVNVFPYAVEYSGIGDGPVKHSEFGCCSQMAVFIRKLDIHPWLNVNLEPNARHEFELVHRVVYPCDDRERNVKLLNEITYLINHFYCTEGEETEEEFTRHVLVAELLDYPGMQKLEATRSEVEEVLSNSVEHRLSEDRKYVVIELKQSDFLKDWESEGGDEGGEGIDVTDYNEYNNNDNDDESELLNGLVLVDAEEENWDV